LCAVLVVLTCSTVIPSIIRVGFKVSESGNPESSTGAISGLPAACLASTRCPEPSASDVYGGFN